MDCGLIMSLEDYGASLGLPSPPPPGPPPSPCTDHKLELGACLLCGEIVSSADSTQSQSQLSNTQAFYGDVIARFESMLAKANGPLSETKGYPSVRGLLLRCATLLDCGGKHSHRVSDAQPLIPLLAEEIYCHVQFGLTPAGKDIVKDDKGTLTLVVG